MSSHCAFIPQISMQDLLTTSQRYIEEYKAAAREQKSKDWRSLASSLLRIGVLVYNGCANVVSKSGSAIQLEYGRIVKVVSIVGMAGAGKSELARVFEKHGFKKVRFGDVTEEEIKNRGLDLNEENERAVREQLRKEHGMAAYAKLNLARIDSLLKSADVVVDGLYSWEEYTLLKERYGEKLSTVAVWASPATRYERLANRAIRPLTLERAASRDRAEIENINKGGPIAMADCTIINESSLEELERETYLAISALK